MTMAASCYLLASFMLFEAIDAFMQPCLLSPARARSSITPLKRLRCSLQEKPPTLEPKSPETMILMVMPRDMAEWCWS